MSKVYKSRYEWQGENLANMSFSRFHTTISFLERNENKLKKFPNRLDGRHYTIPEWIDIFHKERERREAEKTRKRLSKNSELFI